MMVSKELIAASKDYLNSSTISKEETGGYNSLPLVIFPYRMGVRNVLGLGCGIVSLIVPDLGCGVVVGNEIRNPISPKYRYRVTIKGIRKCGLILSLRYSGHSIRIKFNRLLRVIFGRFI